MTYSATAIPGTAVTTPVTASATTTTTTTTMSARRPGLLGGIGGFVFVGTVLAQNAIRSDFPATDVSAEEVMNYYSDHRGATIALAALMPFGLLGLTTFLGTVIARVVRGAGRAAAIAGGFGAAAIIATFTMLTATDVAIAGYIHRGAAELAVVDGMWVVHNAIFGFLMAAIAVALVGLTQACRLDGLLSRRWGVAGLVGGALLLTGAMTTPAMIDGSPTFFVGVTGFVVWMAFIVRTSVALLRSGEDR